MDTPGPSNHFWGDLDPGGKILGLWAFKFWICTFSQNRMIWVTTDSAWTPASRIYNLRHPIQNSAFSQQNLKIYPMDPSNQDLTHFTCPKSWGTKGYPKRLLVVNLIRLAQASIWAPSHWLRKIWCLLVSTDSPRSSNQDLIFWADSGPPGHWGHEGVQRSLCHFW